MKIARRKGLSTNARASILLYFLLIFCLSMASFSDATAQQEKEHNTDSVLERWKTAVIQLEVATDSVSAKDRAQRWFELCEKKREGKITQDEFIKESQTIDQGSKDMRYQGTAIFLEHNNHHYLITARHILFDSLSAKRSLSENTERLKDAPPAFKESILKSAKENAQDQIYSTIFRVLSLDEMLGNKTTKQPAFLMALGAGPSWMHPYTFSAPNIDLAIVSLDRENADFVKELESLGYQPIHMNDISDEPSSVGADVFVVGYPSFSNIRQLNLHPALRNWSSDFVSVPNFAFGKVSMLHKKLPFFWCDLSVYPGFSGSPVIENNKLIGIVSGQQEIPIERVVKDGDEQTKQPDLDLWVRIPFGNIIKAKFVRDLLEEQIKKDSNLELKR
jgi:hypothetical protein